ncbi:MAG: GNAT family N-acetyltransferase [Rickettsiales bacterium]|jgi:RimJ/RimL family protein N-acetyltransferase|nr:GNAT family N-acetyltransferase [Rickettsiales bacterium]
MAITTDRLIIKPFEKLDFRYFLSLNQDEEIMRYFDEGVKSMPKLKERFEEILAHQKKYNFSYYNFFLKDTNEYIGQGGPYYNFDMSVNVCYGLLKKFQKRGYAFEALKSILDDTFKNFQISEVQIRTAVENVDSINLAKKLGGVELKRTKAYSGLNVIYYKVNKKDFYGIKNF